MAGLANKLQRTREVDGERWIHRFQNGLVVHTDAFLRPDRARVLPIGGFQDILLNRLCSFPDIVAGKRVFDPFAGSGIFGLMALQLGAAHVDFLDVSPRARRFQQENAQRNGFAPERYRTLETSIADFEPQQPYDVVVANPPFVPTPGGIAGSLTSNGGAEGNDLLALLLERMGRLLRSEGEAYVYAMQLTCEGEPTVCASLAEQLPGRSVALTPLQEEVIPFAQYADTYRRCFSDRAAEIARWEDELERRRGGSTLGIQHYILHIQAKDAGPGSWSIRDDLEEKYGRAMGYAAESNAELALARVMENVVPVE
jgi:Ribosomal protein L11 methyltransferase (PrmA)